MKLILMTCLFALCCSLTTFAQKKNTVKQSIEDGKVIYSQSCVSCHQVDGLGVPRMNPSLSKTSYVTGDKKVLINVILKGLSHKEVDGVMYHNVMPPFDYLTDKQIADVLTYIRSDFGNKSKPVTEAEVKAVRSAPVK